MPHTDLPVSDPTPHLAPTARRILDAAIRVLDQHGFTGLTFERVAEEAGENKALIRYHFGSKAGLVSAVVDAVLFAEASEFRETLLRLQPGSERRAALFRGQQRLASGPTTFRRFFELIPNMLRDSELRLKLRDFLRWYQTFDAWAITGENPEQGKPADTGPLGLLAVAMLDGLALHAQADSDLDLEPAFHLWEELVAQYLELRGC
jgi:AcrR family transcriptional regulator